MLFNRSNVGMLNDIRDIDILFVSIRAELYLKQTFRHNKIHCLTAEMIFSVAYEESHCYAHLRL